MDSDRKCPGTSFRNLKSETIRCPNCDHENELFGDENMVRCEKCKMKIKRIGEGFAHCLGWCERARECVGDEKYEKWLRHKEALKKQN